MRLCPPISSASIGGTRQLVVQILSIDGILMGYWIEVQVMTTMSSVFYKSKLRTGGNP